MTEINFARTDQVRDILSVFAELLWPAPREKMMEIATRLGWTILSETPNSTRFDTGLPTNPSRGGVTIDNGHIGQVTLNLTDKLTDPDPGSVGELAASTLRFREEITDLLGEPTGVRRGTEPRYTWDLANGGRAALTSSRAVVKLIVLQKRYADIERREEGLGISESRDSEADIV